MVAQNGANRNAGGITPTTVKGSPSSTMARPTMRAIAAEAPLPQPVAEDDDPVAAGLIFAGQERAPDGGWHAERAEQVRHVTCSPGSRSAPSPAARVALHAWAAEIPSYGRELPAVVEIVRRADGELAVVKQHDEAVRLQRTGAA